MLVTAKMSVVPCAPSSFWFPDPRLHSVWLLTSRQMGLDASLCTILQYCEYLDWCHKNTPV